MLLLVIDWVKFIILSFGVQSLGGGGGVYSTSIFI